MPYQWILVFLLAFTNAALAQDQDQTITPLAQDNFYFTIRDTNSSVRASFQNPVDLLKENLEEFSGRAADFNLLQWVRHNEAPKLPTENYDRRKHFGTWIHDATDKTCYNTRAKILIRDSIEAVTFKETNPCNVESGHWSDPYSGLELTKADEVQIDHMVPLKNAYNTGAWKWEQPKRCLYANFQANKIHLISVSSHENQSKGDDSPADYLPPNQHYVCTYLENWLKVKMIWGLEMSPAEAKGIRDNVEKFGCDSQSFQISTRELVQQRTDTEELQVLCSHASKSFQ